MEAVGGQAGDLGTRRDADRVHHGRTFRAGSSSRTVLFGKRTWTDVEPGKYLFSDYEVSKKVMYFLRHSHHVHREDDGAVQFRRI